MPLKRTGGYTKALLAALAALVFFGYEAVVIAYLVQAANWSTLLNPNLFISIIFVFELLVANVLAVALPVGLVWQGRVLRAVRTDPDAVAPLARFQPDRALALRNGETLTLTRRAQSGRMSSVLGGAITLLILSLCGEALIVPVLPAMWSYRHCDATTPRLERGG